MTQAAQNKFMLFTNWINILSKWAVLAVFVFKAGQYTQDIKGKFTLYDSYGVRIARLDSAAIANYNNDNRIHASIWGEIARLRAGQTQSTIISSNQMSTTK